MIRLVSPQSIFHTRSLASLCLRFIVSSTLSAFYGLHFFISQWCLAQFTDLFPLLPNLFLTSSPLSFSSLIPRILPPSCPHIIFPPGMYSSPIYFTAQRCIVRYFPSCPTYITPQNPPLPTCPLSPGYPAPPIHPLLATCVLSLISPCLPPVPHYLANCAYLSHGSYLSHDSRLSISRFPIPRHTHLPTSVAPRRSIHKLEGKA